LIMVVRSPTVSITVEEVPMAYTLTISVSPKTGRVGDTFTFSGGLRYDAERIAGATIDLILEGVGKVGSGVTDALGNYSISWRADRSGALSFHAEAPLIAAVSQVVSVAVAVEAATILAPLAVGAALLGASFWR